LRGFGTANQPVEGFVSNITVFKITVFKIINVSLTAACIAFAAPAWAATPPAPDDFPLIGTYMQNVPCKGDGTDQAALKVTISEHQIVSNVGVCTILENKRDGNSFKLHVECKFPAGPLVGDLTFTPLPDNTVKFVDRDNTYNTILHRCPK
jgi:hypothetical protein